MEEKLKILLKILKWLIAIISSYVAGMNDLLSNF